jgi:hypothetical protein
LPNRTPVEIQNGNPLTEKDLVETLPATSVEERGISRNLSPARTYPHTLKRKESIMGRMAVSILDDLEMGDPGLETVGVYQR